MEYELWISQGQGSVLVEKVATLKEALETVEKEKDLGSWGIKYPDGK